MIISNTGVLLFWRVIIRRCRFGWSRCLNRGGFLLRRGFFLRGGFFLRRFWLFRLRFPNQTFSISFATHPVGLRYLNTRGVAFYFDAERVTERESLIVSET